MKLVIFGLSVSSSWGNGHAALWRGLIGALLRDGHRVVFFERDEPWYRYNRDLHELPEGGRLVLYRHWQEVAGPAQAALDDADAGMVTSYCPDGVAAAHLLLDSRARVRCFYDLDTPVTLAQLEAGQTVPYLLPEGLGGFDLVLSFTGGQALDEIRIRLGGRHVAPLYGSVDPDLHRPAAPRPQYQAVLSWLGTYAEDRQAALDALFLQPARRRPGDRFVLAGAQYPDGFPWTANLYYVRHLPPSEHAAFYASARLTLNVTRGAMARMGFCPSGRLFEAAACGAPLLTDSWEGLDHFFTPGEEVLVAGDTATALAALDTPAATLAAIARRARERTLAQHSATQRARELVGLLAQAAAPAEA
ncbi:Glycosyltransferase [Rhodovastum atsumiense]|uniref:Glycosyltransferase n=1 Tax=Rhodovastum atsumiense TaxID=504468 RepID=A0A5M6IKQ6_9PROT|nr:glycosyltransferase [Rhodovastum atsumiense]KAA5608846.1 glycosyltransferase [Rhodovastum atsumiense]CAH2599327.1 Glycosyltransferase [Rhodovastum atsumiense]